MLVQTYVFRVRPSRAQHKALDRILSDQHHLYNAALEERINAWRCGVSISMNDQTKSLTEIRSFEASYGSVPYNLSKWTLKRLDDEMKSFFRRARQRGGKAGFPRFRSASRWTSFGFHQIGGLRLIAGKLRFSGGIIGALNLRMHRQLPAGAVIKSAIFTKESRHWRVALAVASEAPRDHQAPGSAIGIDVGIEALATLSDGARIDNIRPRKTAERKLRMAARALSRCKRGSRHRKKVRARLAKSQRAVRNVRTAHLHQVSATIARDFELIAVEKLQLRNMTRSARGTEVEAIELCRQPSVVAIEDFLAQAAIEARSRGLAPTPG